MGFRTRQVGSENSPNEFSKLVKWVFKTRRMGFKNSLSEFSEPAEWVLKTRRVGSENPPSGFSKLRMVGRRKVFFLLGKKNMLGKFVWSDGANFLFF